MKTALQAVAVSLAAFVLFGIALFWPAGTFDYWQAWVFIAVYAVLGTASTVYLGGNRPDVLRRRMRSPAGETRPVQKVIAGGVYLMFAALLVVSALDHRFGWSHVPAAVAVGGNALVAVGLGITILVVVQNSYAAATVTVVPGQSVVTTGLYGVVRHPMYTGALVMLVGVPLALGSWWGLVVLVPILVGLAVRIRDEEKALTAELRGYRDYMHDVRFRLVPHVW